MAKKKSIPVKLSPSVVKKALQTPKNRQTTDLKFGVSSSRSKPKTTFSNKEPEALRKRARKNYIREEHSTGVS